MKTFTRFRFGDRVDITRSMLPAQRAHARFLRYLISAKFRSTDDLVHYFYFNRFHDGPVAIEKFDLEKGTLILSFKNVVALDLASNVHRGPWKDRDFNTRVKFFGVSSFAVQHIRDLHQVEVYLTEFWRVGADIAMRIYLIGDRVTARLGVLNLTFRSIQVEDISHRWKRHRSPQLRQTMKQLKKGGSLRDLLRKVESSIHRVQRVRGTT